MSSDQTRRNLIIAAVVAVLVLIIVINFAANRWQKMQESFSCNAPAMPWSWANAKRQGEVVTMSTFSEKSIDIQTVVLAAQPRTASTPKGVAAPKVSVTCGPLNPAEGDEMVWQVTVNWMMGFSVAGMRDVGEHEIQLFGDQDCNAPIANFMVGQSMVEDVAEDWLSNALEHEQVLAEVRFKNGPSHFYRFDFAQLKRTLDEIDECSY